MLFDPLVKASILKRKDLSGLINTEYQPRGQTTKTIIIHDGREVV